MDVPVHGRSGRHHWLLSLTIPESPRYLVAQDKSDQAKVVLGT